MKRRYLSLWGLLILLLLPWTSSRAFAQYTLQMPEDLDKVDIYLHTVDIGNLVYNNFGHTAIRVHDRHGNQDLVFNWGIFDFGKPVEFAFKFYRGILIYKLGVYPYQAAYRQYQYERRTVWEDQLNLTHSEKQILLERLIWNNKPENREYHYHYFFDNCSTRPRDYIDEALGGLLRQRTEASYTDLSFRDYVRQGYRLNPFIQLSLDILMNSRIERRVSDWDSMFHPLDLRKVLLQVDDGRPIIYTSRILMEFPRPATPWLDGFTGFASISLLFLLLIVFLMIRERQLAAKQEGAGSRLLQLAYRLMGALALPAFFYAGVLGILMPVTWVLSDHLDLHHNVNMFLFWPTDLLLLLPAAVWLWKGRAWQLSAKSFALLKRYAILHLAGIFALMILWALGSIDQNVELLLLFVAPVYLALFSLLLHKGISPLKDQV